MTPPTLAYIIGIFPHLSETFIANEILELERQGAKITIYSLLKPEAEVSHECVRQIQAPVNYPPDRLYHPIQRLLRSHLAMFRHSPVRYLRTLGQVIAYTRGAWNPGAWGHFHRAVHLASLFKGTGVQHIHAHMASEPTRMALQVSKLTGIPYSFTGHARDIYLCPLPTLMERIGAAKFVVTCTRYNVEYLQQLVEPEQRHKIKLSYHGLNLAKFSPGQQERLTDTPVVLSVARLVEKKGLPYLLQACSILKGKGLAFRCLIIGEGPQRPVLERMVREQGLADVVAMPGACNQEELLDKYRQATVFALPCIVLDDGDQDGIPNVLLEAMAVQLPVVSTAISGIPEVIRDGHNGLFVEQRDPESLARALEALIRDTSLREKLGRNARIAVQRDFDLPTSAQRLTKLFSNGVSKAD